MKNLLPIPFVIFIWMPVFLCGISSCEKDPEVIIKTETIIDTLVLLDTITIIDFQTLPDTATTFILVRHAETTGAGSNPNLSAAGLVRANELARILEEVDLNAIYSTNFNRTLQTSQPSATAKGLSITQYDPFSPNELIDNVLLSYPEGVVLVVGHSNTTASMLNAIVGSTIYADLAENEYDNLFIVHVSERGQAKVTRLKYGM